VKQIDLVALIGRSGPEAALTRHSRKVGVMESANTRRNRSRAAKNRRAIEDAS